VEKVNGPVNKPVTRVDRMFSYPDEAGANLGLQPGEPSYNER
jgi:hypothetical protein